MGRSGRPRHAGAAAGAEVTVQAHDYDVIVVGSGFGGSVTALRLTEKGYRVGVLEAGRRWTAETLPRTSWDARNFLWAPRLRCFGIQRITALRNVLVLSGAGVGGGSLVYANTLYQPGETFYADPQWSGITDWRDELAPHYDQARRMLGVVTNPLETAADRVVRAVAEEMGVGRTFVPTPVGVWFGEPGVTVPDPYFGGAGPARTGCIACGACMTGCRYGAKNRLDANYLHLAERAGAVVHAESEVVDLRPLASGAGYAVDARRPGSGRRTPVRTLTAEHVVLSAGALGTQRLLHDLVARGRLPRLSRRLGHVTRTNSEAILGAKARTADVDYSGGVAITSSFYPEPDTHVEPVRYGKGDNLMGAFGTVLVDGDGRMPRWLRTFATIARRPAAFVRAVSLRRWSERTIVLLVMQTRDNSIRVRRKRGLLGARLTSEQDAGRPNPTWLPVANDVARRVAARIGGDAGNSWNEVLLGMPMTAHILGGCVIGSSPRSGVVDAYHRAYGHEGLHVVDGSAVTANPGVNPSLTITAMAERAMSYWPNKGEPDPRPPLGAAYRRIDPVAPRRPAVPVGAAAELWPGAVPERRAGG
ncbi:MAG: GMC oxidoreductase [Frankiaceae bacterium]